MLNSHAYAASFPDVHKTSEVGKAIEQLSERKIISGFPDGTFKPNAPLTRQQAAKMVANILNITPNHFIEVSFTDVDMKNSNYQSIVAVAELGIMTGYEDGSFKPSEKLTRSQAAKIISEAFRLRSTVIKQPYSDVKSEQTVFYVSNLYNNHVTQIEGKYFYPNQNVTRAQFSLFLTRAEKASTAFTKYATDYAYSAFSFTEYDENIVDVELDMYRLTLHPLSEGTARIVIYTMNEFEELERYFYLVHVDKVNGQFHISLEEESIYEHISYTTSIYHYSDGLYLQFIPTKFELYDEFGKPVSEESYHIEINGEEVEVTMFRDGAYQLYFSNESERSTHAILAYIESFLLDFTIETIAPFIEITSDDLGYVVKEATIVDYLNYVDAEKSPFTLTFENDTVIIKPSQLGEGVVRFIDSKGTKHYIDVVIHEKAGILVVDVLWE